MKNSRNAFTLIELLVVIAIIAILAAITFPAINKALLQAKINKAKAETLAIAAAIDLYWNDYGQLPVPPNAQGLTSDEANTYFTDAVSRSIIQVLIAEPSGDNANHQLNPRRKVYLSMEAAKSNGELLDPFGTQYRIVLDRNLDGKVEYPIGLGIPLHRKRAVVVSAGPDRLWTGGSGNKNIQDNVANVEVRTTP